MIDAHCHVDLFPNPHLIADFSEKNDIPTIGVTNLPSHFEMGYAHIRKYRKVRLALGLHPLYAEQHEKEYDIFKKNIDRTSYIGEVGLDFSREGVKTKNIQLKTFNYILSELSNEKKFISIHSRRAETKVLDLLKEYKTPIAVFHWYSGSIKTLQSIADAGYYFSINPAMIKSKAGQRIIREIPKNLLLTESDGPFINVGQRYSQPKDVRQVLEYLTQLHQCSFDEINKLVNTNFYQIIHSLK